MQNFSRSPIWAAAGLALGCGLVLLQPTQASAQINIEGLIRGALSQGCCYGGGGYRPHYRSSGSGYTRHARSRENNDDSAPVDKTKERDATQVEAPNNNAASAHQQAPAPAPSQPDPTPKQTSAVRGNDDQPAFAPSR
jgi:hypothetical protein